LDEKVSSLVVDGRADKLLAYEVMLADLNENIVWLRSGKEALRQLLQKDFAAILFDVNLGRRRLILIQVAASAASTVGKIRKT